jgi:hypothetical protein
VIRKGSLVTFTYGDDVSIEGKVEKVYSTKSGVRRVWVHIATSGTWIVDLEQCKEVG